MIMMVMVIVSEIGAESGESDGGRKWSSWTPILSHCVSQPNLTEPLDIERNEEYGQKRNCPPGPLF